MTQQLQVIVNGHRVTIDADENLPTAEFKAVALRVAGYVQADSTRWRLIDDQGYPVTVKIVGDIPPLTYLSLPAGIGA